MKLFVFVLTAFFASVSFGKIIFQQETTISFSAQHTITNFVEKMCPIATERAWLLYENQTTLVSGKDERNEMNQHSLISISVYGEDIYLQQPENGEIQIEFVESPQTNGEVKILKMKGLCR